MNGKFLLVAVNAKYIHSNPGIYSLKACSGELSDEVELAEYTINLELDLALRDIYRRRPAVLGLSCYIWNIRYIKELTEVLGRVCPGLPVWLGGPEVSHCAAEILERMPEVTGVMRGEGEIVFKHVLSYYAAGAPALEDIPGITWREPGGRIVENLPERPARLNEVPFLYEGAEKFENKIIYYESSRGCPFSCSYCLSSVDRQVRFKSLPVVFRELQRLLDQKVKQVKFVDRTFNCRKSHGLEIWKYLKEHDNGVTNFHFEIAADLIGEEELDVISGMRPGLIQLETGVQSTNPRTLKEIRRNADFSRISQVTERIRKFGNTHQHLDLIAGLPYEDYESFGRSFNDVYRLRPDQLQLGFLKVLRGSHMYDMAESYGLVYRPEPPYEVLYTRWLSYEDVLKLKAVEEMVEVYYNSGQFSNTMEYLLRFFPSAFSMYEALARYYEDKGLLGMGHTRLKRYEILSDFAILLNLGKRVACSSVLMYDIYLRENAKSLPGFRMEQGQYWERVRAFFRQEEKERRYLKGREGLSAKQMMYDAHVEVFPVDMELLLKEGVCQEEECAVLFDYSIRDPLHRNAGARRIALPQ